MPTYDFKCSSCGHETELVLSMAERSQNGTMPCPACGSKMQALFTTGGFKVKGGTPKFSFSPLSETRPKSYVPGPVRRAAD